MAPSIRVHFRLESGPAIDVGWIEFAINGVRRVVEEARAVTPAFLA